MQEGGSVPRQTVGRVLTTSVTSRHRSVIFKMAGKFVVRYFPKKCGISYGLDDLFTLFDITQDSKNMRDLFAIVSSSQSIQKRQTSIGNLLSSS